MTIVGQRDGNHLKGRATFRRQPVWNADNAVYAYAVRGDVEAAPDLDPEVADRRVEAGLTQLDLPGIASDRPVLLRATRALLQGELPLPVHGAGLILEVPAAFLDQPEVPATIAWLTGRGLRIALGDYHGTHAQDALLPLVSYVKVDAWLETTTLDLLVGRAHESDVKVIAERATGHIPVRRALEADVDYLQGPMFPRNPAGASAELTAGELQCLELMRLLSTEDPNQNEVTRVVSADPGMSVRLLHLVNSTAFGLTQRVDSVRRSVVLAGPRQIAALATASLIGAHPTSTAKLWSTLSRAITCRTLSGTEAGYTVGLLSAISGQLAVPVEELVERTGVSDDIAEALTHQRGRLGAILAAVVAHEENDEEAVRATGLEPSDVGHAYLQSVAEALSIAESLSAAPGKF